MIGSGLTRYRPDPTPTQDEGGFFNDFVRESARSGWQRLKKGCVLGLPNIPGAIRDVKRGAKRVVKRKALDTINRQAKRKLTDIFAE